MSVTISRDRAFARNAWALLSRDFVIQNPSDPGARGQERRGQGLSRADARVRQP